MLEVSVFLDQDDTVHGDPMYEYLLRYLMHHHIAGATVFRLSGGTDTSII
jgi:PII-like signaling protein